MRNGPKNCFARNQPVLSVEAAPRGQAPRIRIPRTEAVRGFAAHGGTAQLQCSSGFKPGPAWRRAAASPWCEAQDKMREVWLLTGGGALFAAFPIVYATVFSRFYLALMLLLVALIFRAVSMEFRGWSRR